MEGFQNDSSLMTLSANEETTEGTSVNHNATSKYQFETKLIILADGSARRQIEIMILGQQGPSTFHDRLLYVVLVRACSLMKSTISRIKAKNILIKVCKQLSTIYSFIQCFPSVCSYLLGSYQSDKL